MPFEIRRRGLTSWERTWIFVLLLASSSRWIQAMLAGRSFLRTLRLCSGRPSIQLSSFFVYVFFSCYVPLKFADVIKYLIYQIPNSTWHKCHKNFSAPREEHIWWIKCSISERSCVSGNMSTDVCLYWRSLNIYASRIVIMNQLGSFDCLLSTPPQTMCHGGARLRTDLWNHAGGRRLH